MTRLLSFLTLAAAVTAPISLVIRPGSAETFTAVLSGPVAGSAAGPFSGTVSLNGSGTQMAVKAQAERAADGRLRLPLELRYADIPADWADRFRLGALEYRVRGTVAGREPVEWTGTMAWKDVGIEGEKETLSRFVRLSSLEMTRFSLFESEARASVTVRNPFSFPLKLAGASYRLFADGREVGSGEAHGMLLRPGQDNALDFPIEIEHGQLLAAAGSALASGGEIDGRLSGHLVVRLPGGDVTAPLELSGKLALGSQ